MKPKPFARFYFPGLISLVLLPLMCIVFLAYTGRLERLAMMEVFWTNDNFYKAGYIYKNKAFDPYTYRKLQNITITSLEEDTILLNNVKAKIDKLISAKDTINGYCVLFSDKTTYGNLVGVLDICTRYAEKGLLYYPYKNRIFIFNNIYQQYDGDPFKGDVVREPPPVPSKFDMMAKSFLHFKKEFIRSGTNLVSFWPSLLVFILMVFFAIRNKRRLQTARR